MSPLVTSLQWAATRVALIQHFSAEQASDHHIPTCQTNAPSDTTGHYYPAEQASDNYIPTCQTDSPSDPVSHYPAEQASDHHIPTCQTGSPSDTTAYQRHCAAEQASDHHISACQTDAPSDAASHYPAEQTSDHLCQTDAPSDTSAYQSHYPAKQASMCHTDIYTTNGAPTACYSLIPAEQALYFNGPVLENSQSVVHWRPVTSQLAAAVEETFHGPAAMSQACQKQTTFANQHPDMRWTELQYKLIHQGHIKLLKARCAMNLATHQKLTTGPPIARRILI